MNVDWLPIGGYCLYEPQYYIKNNTRRKARKQMNHYQTSIHLSDRGFVGNQENVMQRAASEGRHYSVDEDNISRRRRRRQAIKQKQSGWFQANPNLRNQSVDPALPVYEPMYTYTFKSNSLSKRKRHNKKGWHHLSTWSNTNRFPPEEIMNKPTNLMRELPFARLHYDSFRRMFPTMVTRAAKDRRQRIQAAQELPYANYPDNQLKDIFFYEKSKEGNVISLKGTSEKLRSEPTSPHCVDNLSGTTIKESDVDEQNETFENGKLINTGLNPYVIKPEQIRLCKVITPISEETISDAENKQELYNIQTEPVKKWEKGEMQLPYIDTESEFEGAKQVPLASYDEVSSSIYTDPKLYDSENCLTMFGDYSASKSIETRYHGGSRTKKPPLNKQNPRMEQIDVLSRENPSPETEHTVPPPQVTASLFESASAGQMTGALPCKVCLQLAYPAERCVTNGQVFHTSCFRCHACSNVLHRGSWNQRESHFYCNPCHRKIALQTLRH